MIHVAILPHEDGWRRFVVTTLIIRFSSTSYTQVPQEPEDDSRGRTALLQRDDGQVSPFISKSRQALSILQQCGVRDASLATGLRCGWE